MATRVADIGTNRAFTGIDLGDDRELVLAFQSGDDDAYAGIYLKYRNLAAQICYRILQDRDEVEEAVQETMLRVYRGLPRFNGRYQLQAWVARIATNVSLDMIRARSRRPQRAPALHDISEEFETLAGPSADDSIDELERILDQEEVRGILSAIPEHHRDALVLREFEGRSHEEIASAMGVSPDQAKALIHRAKKSFRRAWDGEVERRGIAALAPILLAPFKLPGFLRRLAQPAHDAVANVAATAQQAAVQVTASPAVAQGSVSIADKVTAAALTVIVAGTVSVGAVAIRHRDQTPKPPVASTAPAPAPLVVVAAPLVGAEGRVAPKQQHRRHHHAAPATQGGEQASPSAVPSATPAGSDPSGSPSPSPESPAPPPPAPAWSGSFEGVGGLSADHLVQVSQSVTGRPSGQMLFGETMSGPVAGPQHQHLGDVYADFSGWLSGGRGALSSVWLWIDAPEGQYRYAADGILSSAVQGSDGSTTYVFSGEYHLSGIPDLPGAEVPHDGTLAISVTFWGDGTLYGADVSLS